MNLAVEAPVRTILREEDAVNTLSAIADYSTMSIPEESQGVDPIVGEMQRQFQCLKAVSTKKSLKMISICYTSLT